MCLLKSLGSCMTLCDPMDCSPTRLLCPRDSPGKDNGMSCHALLQGIFPTRLNPNLLCLLHCRRYFNWSSYWHKVIPLLTQCFMREESTESQSSNKAFGANELFIVNAEKVRLYLHNLEYVFIRKPLNGYLSAFLHFLFALLDVQRLMNASVKVLHAQSCLILCDPMDCNPPGPSLSMDFSRQEYWSGLSFPSPGDLPDSGIKPSSPTS